MMNAYLSSLIACLFLCGGLNSFGASYVTIDGTIVDPIKYRDYSMGNHPYNGYNLEPDAYLSRAVLTYADLSNANLTSAYLPRAVLTYADLSNADLTSAYLINADLSNANLSGADLSNANLDDAYLSDANLSGADLSNANLFDADLSLADLIGANLSDANLSHADLSDALYNNQTVFTLGFDPIAAGMSYVPVPAAAWLFGSALVGLGLVRIRSKKNND